MHESKAMVCSVKNKGFRFAEFGEPKELVRFFFL